MEKKGDLLNQMAIISDLLEKVNINIDSRTIILTLPEDEFIKVFEYIQKKQNKIEKTPKDTFTINIGDVNIFFNMSNV
jgi:hypothetical protein